MYLIDLKKGDKAVIVKVHANKALKDRLSSFGVIRGEELIIKGCSFRKKTIEIEVGSTHIALRADEAAKIEVNKVTNSIK